MKQKAEYWIVKLRGFTIGSIRRGTALRHASRCIPRFDKAKAEIIPLVRRRDHD